MPKKPKSLRDLANPARELTHTIDGRGEGSQSSFEVINPSTGAGSTAWNPTRDRGQGADDMLVTAAGLWIASDTFFGSKWCGGFRHPGICFFPY